MRRNFNKQFISIIVCEMGLWRIGLRTLFLQFLFSLSVRALSSGNETTLLLTKTLDALDGALTFFHRQHKNVNLDAVIGTRIVESQLKVLLARIESSPSKWDVPTSVLQRITRIQSMAGLVSDEAVPYIATLTPKYYHKIGNLLRKGFWELDYPSRDFPRDLLLWPYREGEALHEEDSDNCLAELFGTGEKKNRKCDISDHCWKVMTKPGYNGYSLSHEVFYLEIGQQFGCGAEMMIKLWLSNQPSASELQSTFCANMLNEAALIAKNGYPQRRQDLFMEQAALCGMLGYRQFFTSDWLEAMLSWQNPSIGCYTGQTVRESEVDYRPEAAQLIRRKREERPLEHGCLCHRTTVAVGALSQYVRYILEYMALQGGRMGA